MKTKPLILAGAFLASATSAEAADAWTCTYEAIDDKPLVRFEIATPDLIETQAPRSVIPPTGQGTHYRILQNNDYGLVATFSISGIEEGGKDPYVGATSVVINKMTSEFYWVEAITTTDKAITLHQSQHGKCLHD